MTSFAVFGLTQLVILLAVWFICGWVAYAIAPDRPALFFLVTFFILGPFGVAAALIAPLPEQPVSRRKIAAGRRRFLCPRCGAENDIPEKDEGYSCWRCSERRKVDPLQKVSPPSNKG
jgi:DNA-directed RNA polymerase subunit RPC12/RpoP